MKTLAHALSLLPHAFSEERDRLVLWLPVLLACGVALYFAQEAPSSVWPAIGLFLICLAGIWKIHALVIRIWLVIVATMLLGFVVSGLRVSYMTAPTLNDKVFFKEIIGTIDMLEQKEGKTKLYLRNVTIETVDEKNTPKYVSIVLRDIQPELRIGQKIQIAATLFPPPTPAMPESYDFSRMFYFKQLGAVGFSPRRAEIVDTEEITSSYDRLTALRLAIADRMAAQMDKDESAVAAAMMVGDQSRISEDVAESMRISGIYHILSISGMHMTIAVGWIYFAVRLLLSLFPAFALHVSTKKIAAMVGLIGGSMYLLLSGYPVAAVRAYIMIACVMTAILFDRKGISLYSLAWAATIILLFAPESLFTAGFQLSFSATLAIIVLYERYGYLLYSSDAGIIRRFFLYFIAIMCTSLAATLYTTPLALYHFNRLAIWGVAANMLMVPLSSFWVMPVAVISFILMPFGVEGLALNALNTGIHWMIAGSNMVASWPYADIVLPSPTFGGFILIIFGGLWFAIWRTNIRWAGVPAIITGLATIALFQPYDMIISEDAKRIAYRSSNNQWAFIRGRTDSFEAEIWLRSSGVRADDAMTRTQAKKILPELSCDKSTCMIEREGQMIVVATRYDRGAWLCESGADVIISDRYLPYKACLDAELVIDRDFVELHGAVALRFLEGGIEVHRTDETRGNWPWSKK